MKRFLVLALALGALATVASVGAACGDSNSSHDGMMEPGNMMSQAAPAGSIEVKLLNWAVQPAQTSTKAGRVTFHVVHDMAHMHGGNEGGATHDLQVMKRKADGGLDLVGQVQGLAMGQSRDLTLDLAAGDYELSCNVVEEVDGKPVPHYARGMHVAFKVT